ncbi:DUF1934 domain-containing protein [Peribacillus glennii]|uniref:DUF1934 domain-containing protein n=1 Tax=Peribacillus glennii TaxID=2303991 RepID=A0A372L9U3_9BACI|nr:DUF1934 domain-containing protein [Peribacillus glennii]RFU62364.1 DUF1934 domain-containing protein [Peribacillus glennii]
MSQQETEKQKVKVKLRTTIRNGAETETYEFTTFGMKFTKGNALYLQYTEEDENGKTQTTVKYKEPEALIMRGGAVKMRQVFNPGETMNGHYESRYGSMPMQTKTESVHHVWAEEKHEGMFVFRYELFMQGDLLGQYEMAIAYKEEA